MAFSLKSLLKRTQKDTAAYDADDDDSFAPDGGKSRGRSGKSAAKSRPGKAKSKSAPLAFLKPVLAKIPFLKGKVAAAQGPDPFDNPILLALIASELEALPPPVVERPEPPVSAAPPAAGAPPANDPFAIREEPSLRALDDAPAYAEEDFPGLDGATPDDPFAIDAADDAYLKRRRRRTVTGMVSTAALLLALVAGLWWLFGSSEPDPWVAEGLTVLNEKGEPIALPPSEAVVSGWRLSMAMPPPPKAALQAKADAGAALGTEKSTSRRPWLSQGQDGQVPTDPAAPPPAPPESSAAAVPAEKPADAAAASVDPNAGKPKVVDQLASLPMLVDPLGPTLRASGGKTPSYAALPDLKTPPTPLKDAPDPDLAKRGSLGILPILGKDGRASWQAYAHPFKVQAPLPANAPRISVIIGGLGMNPDATDAAILKLPPEVTLAFSPYSPRLDELVKKARAHGHEVLLELPLEPENFPSQDPGPLGLLTILPQIDNLTRLETILGKTTGYVGLLGRMGGKFGASPLHMRPLLEALSKYGLMYVHTASPKGLGDMRGISAPVVQNIVMVDDRPFREAFDARLSYLVTVAKQRGTAIGVTNPSPLAYDRLLVWMAALQAQGVVFAPVSAVTGIPAG